MHRDQPYYYRLRGQTLGPYSLDQMQQRAATGRVGRRTSVSRDGMTWATADQFPELFDTPEANRSGPAEEHWHYQGASGEQSEAATSGILQMLANGQLKLTSLVWKDGFEKWKPIHDVTELTPLIPAPAATEDTFEHSISSPAGANPGGANQVFCRECGSHINRLAVICPKCGVPSQNAQATHRPHLNGGGPKNKFVAAVLAFFLGGFGVHHFYLGNPAIGVLYLLFCWTFIPAIIAFVEFIVFLVMPEKDFDARYNT